MAYDKLDQGLYVIEDLHWVYHNSVYHDSVNQSSESIYWTPANTLSSNSTWTDSDVSYTWENNGYFSWSTSSGALDGTTQFIGTDDNGDLFIAAQSYASSEYPVVIEARPSQWDGTWYLEAVSGERGQSWSAAFDDWRAQQSNGAAATSDGTNVYVGWAPSNGDNASTPPYDITENMQTPIGDTSDGISAVTSLTWNSKEWSVGAKQLRPTIFIVCFPQF